MPLESPTSPTDRAIGKWAPPALWMALLLLLPLLGWRVSLQFANVDAAKYPVPDALDQALVVCEKAVNTNNPTWLRSLLQRHPKLVSMKIHNSGGVSFLSRAIDEQNRDCFDVLLEMGASVESQSDLGQQTVLMQCAGSSRRAEYAKTLLERGANPVGLYVPEMGVPPDEAVTQGWLRSPLAIAAITGNTAVAKLLIVHGAPIVLDKKRNETDLHRAVVGGGNVRPMIQLLLEYGANPNARNWLGLTPLHIAAMNHAVEGARTLFECSPVRIAIDRRASTGNTELTLAILELEKRAEVDKSEGSSERQTWRTEAIEMVKLLIEKEADLESLVKIHGRLMTCRDAINALPVPELQTWLQARDLPMQASNWHHPKDRPRHELESILRHSRPGWRCH